jgi:hypothetical protein
LVEQIRSQPTEKIDALLMIMEKARQKKTLTADEQQQLTTSVPDKSLRASVQSRLIREEISSELRQVQISDPDDYVGTTISLRGAVKNLRGSVTPEQIKEFEDTSLAFLAKRPALFSEPLKAELKAAIDAAGNVVIATPKLAMDRFAGGAMDLLPPTVAPLVYDGMSAEDREKAENFQSNMAEQIQQMNQARRQEWVNTGRDEEQAINDLRSAKEQAFSNLIRVADKEGERLNFNQGDLAGLTGVIHQQGDGFAQLFAQEVRQELLGGVDKSACVAINVDLKSKMSYVLSQTLQNFEKKETMLQLALILDKLEPPTQPLTPNENQILRDMGLRFHEGKLHNLANKQEVSTQDLAQLKQLVRAIQRYHDPQDVELNKPYSSDSPLSKREALRDALNVMAQSQFLQQEVAALAAEIAQNDVEIRNQTRQHNETLAEITVVHEQGQEQETCSTGPSGNS